MIDRENHFDEEDNHNDHDHDHDHDDGECGMSGEDALAEMTDTGIFLQMRSQNIELLQVAVQVAGYAQSNGPLKPHDLRNAMKNIWEVYSEFYEWIDPEEIEDDEEADDEDE